MHRESRQCMQGGNGSARGSCGPYGRIPPGLLTDSLPKEGNALTASYGHELLLRDACIPEAVDGFAVGDYDGTCPYSDAVGSREASKSLPRLFTPVNGSWTDLLVKVGMGDEYVVCLGHVIHSQVLGQDRWPV